MKMGNDGRAIREPDQTPTNIGNREMKRKREGTELKSTGKRSNESHTRWYGWGKLCSSWIRGRSERVWSRTLEVDATNLQPYLPQHTNIESRPWDKEEDC